MILTIKRGDVVEQHKMFHFEYAVLLEFLNDEFKNSSLGNKVVARDLCFYGLVVYGDVEFKLERV